MDAGTLRQLATAPEPDDAIVDRLRAGVIGAPDPGAALTALAEVAADDGVPARGRLNALLATARAAVATDRAIPDAALDAVEAAAVIDGALAARRVEALTAVVGLAGDRVGAASRARLAATLLARGARGPHVTRLLLDAGDLAGAARAAADDFLAAVRPAASSPARVALAWAELLVGWAERHGPPFVEPLRDQLAAHDGAARALTELLDRVDGGARVAAALRGEAGRQ